MARTNAPAVRSTVNAQAYNRLLRPGQYRARNETEAIQWMIERKLMEISMNRFEWSGMDDISINIRWMEMAINFTALSVFHQVVDPRFGVQYEALRGGPGSKLTRTGDPASFWIYTQDNTPNEEIPAEDCVPIWGNFMRIPDWDIITIYAHRMAEMDRTIEINAEQLRHSKVLKTTPNTSQSIRNINRQLREGNPVIEIDVSSMDPLDAIEVFDMGLDHDQLMNLHIVRTREWSECMTLLGINNANQDKKERLTAAETAGNDDVIATIRETNLKARRIACDQINEKYGLNVSVDYTTDMKTAVMKGEGANDEPAVPADKVGA